MSTDVIRNRNTDRKINTNTETGGVFYLGEGAFYTNFSMTAPGLVVSHPVINNYSTGHLIRNAHACSGSVSYVGEDSFCHTAVTVTSGKLFPGFCIFP